MGNCSTEKKLENKLLLQCSFIAKLQPKAFSSANKQPNYLLFTVKLQLLVKLIKCPHITEKVTVRSKLSDRPAFVN